VPRGLLSLLAPLWLTAFLTAGVWLAAGVAAGFVTLGVVGTVALLVAEWVLDDPDAPQPDPRVRQVERGTPPRQLAAHPDREPAVRRLAAHLRRLGDLVPRPRLVRPRYLLAGVVGMLVAAMLVLFAVQTPARAESETDGNPWSMTMDGPGDGLVLTGDDGPENDHILVAYDYLMQPVAGIGEDAGLWVMGDDLRVISDVDVYHAQVTISPYAADPAACVRNGQLWVGGPGGQIHRCADLDGPGGPSPFAWWLVA
jgi:hypothetical protein